MSYCKNPLVTIIIPVYNGSNYLAQAIDSALAQSYNNIEVIVVNDGSTDNGATEAIAKSYGEKIRYISKANGGVSSALNVGIREMKGIFCSWLSHDDLYLPNKVEHQVAFYYKIIKEKGESYKDSVVYSPIMVVNSEGKYITKSHSLSKVVQNPEYVFSNLIKFHICGCSTLIPRSLFEKIGCFDEGMLTVQDADFWYRILLTGHSYLCDNTFLVKNRRHNGQTSHRLNEKWLSEISSFQLSLIDKIQAQKSLANTKVFTGLAKFLYIKGMPSSLPVIKEILKTNTSIIEYYLFIMPRLFLWRICRFCRSIMKFIYNKFFLGIK